jgi:hypothetical protein
MRTSVSTSRSETKKPAGSRTPAHRFQRGRYAKLVALVIGGFALWVVQPGLAVIALFGIALWFVFARGGSRAGLVAWLLASAAIGCATWIVYALNASSQGAVPRCGSASTMFFGPTWSGGGQASHGSYLAAALVGGVLWLAGGVSAWRLRRKLGFLLVGFIALYVCTLVVLWYVSPHIWGPRFC